MYDFEHEISCIKCVDIRVCLWYDNHGRGRPRLVCDEEVSSVRYSIPEVNMESLEKKLTRIGNKCAKYGCDFRFERVGEHFEEITEKGDDGVVRSYTVKFIDVDVEGKAVVDGWRFAATLTFTDRGNIIEGYGLEIPERYYSCGPWCEHCKTRRDRKNSYIVFNESTGEFKQVGRSCLKDFTGGLSAENVALFESYFKEIEEAREDIGFGWGTPYFKLDEFMVTAAETIRLFGYVKRNAGDVPTVCRAEDYYRVEHGMRLGLGAEKVREDYDRAVELGFNTKNPKSVELAKMVREWIVGNSRDDNYFHNLKVACSLDWGAGKALGLIVSAFPTYDRELAYEDERRERERVAKEEAARSTWMGEVGDKVSFVLARVDVITSWETQWGMTRVYKLTDENGVVATWKTGSWLDDDDIGKTVKGTVKELKEFRGVKQTELTRCRVA